MIEASRSLIGRRLAGVLLVGADVFGGFCIGRYTGDVFPIGLSALILIAVSVLIMRWMIIVPVGKCDQ